MVGETQSRPYLRGALLLYAVVEALRGDGAAGQVAGYRAAGEDCRVHLRASSKHDSDWEGGGGVTKLKVQIGSN